MQQRRMHKCICQRRSVQKAWGNFNCQCQTIQQQGANQEVQRGGVCWRHGANRITHDESTAFGSEFEKTTETQTPPNQLLLELPQEKDRKEVEFLKRLPFFVKILLNGCVVSMPRAFLAF
eukprot:scaffold8193_cov191-Skeletonema_marinoi.AAC.1